MSKRKGRRRPLTSEIKSVMRAPRAEDGELESPASEADQDSAPAALDESEPSAPEPPPSEDDREPSSVEAAADLGPPTPAPAEPEAEEAPKPARGRRLHAVKALEKSGAVDAGSPEADDPETFPSHAALDPEHPYTEDALDSEPSDRPELPPFPLDGVDADDTEAFLRGLIEALLFTSQKPLPLKDIARSAGLDRLRAKELVDQLTESYRGRGLCIEEVAGGFVMRSSPRYAPYIQKLLALRPIRLSRAQLETLAIIAYRQPVTKPEVDDIRGVDSGQVIKGLLERALLKILGKKDEPGRPMLYGTTNDFLELLNLQSLKDLPTLREYTELSEDSQRKFMEETGEEAPSGAPVGMDEGGIGDLATFEPSALGAEEAGAEAVGDPMANEPEGAAAFAEEDDELERAPVGPVSSEGERMDRDEAESPLDVSSAADEPEEDDDDEAEDDDDESEDDDDESEDDESDDDDDESEGEESDDDDDADADGDDDDDDDDEPEAEKTDDD